MTPWRATAATAWLKKRGCFVEAGEKYTHLLLDGRGGGKARVDDADIGEFYEAIADDVEAGRHNYIVEQKSSPAFPFFLDLDCEDAADIGDDILERWIPLIHEVVKETVVEREGMEMLAVVCRAPVKRKADGKVKSGFHVHWPDVLVDKAKALELRGYIICKLHGEFGERTGNSWNAVVDPSVMLDNGLRMLYSLKCARCPACPASVRDLEKKYGGCLGSASSSSCPCACAFCEAKRNIRKACSCHYGKVEENRPYTYVQEIDGDGEVVDAGSQRTPLQLLYLTSVRTTVGRETSAIVDLRPPLYYDAALVDTPGARQVRERGAPQTRVAAVAPHNGNALDRGGKLYAAVKEALKGVPVSNAFKEGEGQASVYWVWTRSHACKNVGRAHANNNVWFEINRNGAFQRCFDDECRHYRSDPDPIPYDVAVRLFSTTTTESGTRRESAMSTAALRLAYRVSYDPMKATKGKRGRGKETD